MASRSCSPVCALFFRKVFTDTKSTVAASSGYFVLNSPSSTPCLMVFSKVDMMTDDVLFRLWTRLLYYAS